LELQKEVRLRGSCTKGHLRPIMGLNL
jgi:hypothetical protein